MSLKDDLQKLAKLKRSRANLEKIQEQLTEVREMADNASESISALDSARQALADLEGALDCDDNPLISWAPDVREMTQEFLAETPDAGELDALVADAEGYADAYEGCLDDSDYSADDREEAWGELLNALDDLAEGIP